MLLVGLEWLKELEFLPPEKLPLEDELPKLPLEEELLLKPPLLEPEL
ncbi:MAG: hypothetical protein MJ186_06525 [Clostridia bacterium]|nr:hypothetical protein [Clostridia bacterium]